MSFTSPAVKQHNARFDASKGRMPKRSNAAYYASGAHTFAHKPSSPTGRRKIAAAIYKRDRRKAIVRQNPD